MYVFYNDFFGKSLIFVIFVNRNYNSVYRVYIMMIFVDSTIFRFAYHPYIEIVEASFQ